MAVSPRSRRYALPKAPAFGDGHIHLSVAFHTPGYASVRLLLRLFPKLLTKKHSEKQHQKDDHQRRTDKFRDGKLPSQKHQHDDAELKYQIRGGHLEGHRGGEVGALAKDRAGDGDCRIGAGRGSCTESKSRCN
jgi:hypothetical protein